MLLKLPSTYLECCDDRPSDVKRILNANRVSDSQRISCAEVAEPHKIEHQLEAPEDRNAFLPADPAESAVVGDADPSSLAGKDEAEVVLSRQRSSLLGSRHYLRELGFEDTQSKLSATVLVKTIDLTEDRGEHVDLAHVSRHKPED